MTETDRSTVLTAFTDVVAGAPGRQPWAATAVAPVDRHGKRREYTSYRQIYADPVRVEGRDYRRRYGWSDTGSQRPVPSRTTVLAPHGGGIEAGTSEICLAVAGYHPGTLRPLAGGPRHDYWMFEGLLEEENSRLHVTSIGCDDPIALAMAGGGPHALGVHGCDAASVPDPGPRRDIAVVGGLDERFKDLLKEELGRADIPWRDANTVAGLEGTHRRNPCNRTALGMGAQLELTEELRRSMFGRFLPRDRRRNDQLPRFWAFTDAVRTAIARREAAEVPEVPEMTEAWEARPVPRRPPGTPHP
ncbi:poly-gamma-glutamate hydrolase family protein [Streptomyces sp. NPDC020965]|uniref:poly-gamma-glutamate hydrolase family protein n=1 Tax=Streptomyces sp. NPDC020965 TaxID=3365105 RepID=UPI0037B4131E